ncbi:biotin-dependent carboxyltransferase family protein [Desertibacillus haloalkaliphilus]|uniref:5-oxoprolinase subunit C family protein n=1 Tax=Desertibacillus haloalkaliphilus TaxID=1328930 RepID=UPI001C252B89|nr:biotin-dependent carboxyltransferase family protein [Desertibacillus haloalkaliphilus]MBU8907547.1 biotin-dependent carboxyltransferase family protein [Desertibacillus haloalkaliphilus]
MKQEVCEVQSPGLLTTVQDLGRFGYQQYGIVTAGAMDSYALQVGNLLVGNEREEAGLEVTVMGPKLNWLTDAVIAITGANLSPMIDGREVPMWKSIWVRKGQRLSFGKPVDGARAYVTIAGGVDVPEVVSSKSTYLKASLGGFFGRELQRGDIISRTSPTVEINHVGKTIHSDLVPKYAETEAIRVILGPDEASFSRDGLDTFLGSTYTVSPQADRMGYRLSGPKIDHVVGADLLSDAIVPGTIQVPANGQPIVLLADRQTTGGYTRIATVISVDLPYISQLLPGQQVRFQTVSVEQAQTACSHQQLTLRRLKMAVDGIKR